MSAWPLLGFLQATNGCVEPESSEDLSERPLISENGGKVSAAVSCVEDCIHPVQSCVLPCRAVPCLTVAQLSVSPHRADSLVLSKRLTAAPLPALHVDSYHWTNAVSYVQTWVT